MPMERVNVKNFAFIHKICIIISVTRAILQQGGGGGFYFVHCGTFSSYLHPSSTVRHCGFRFTSSFRSLGRAQFLSGHKRNVGSLRRTQYRTRLIRILIELGRESFVSAAIRRLTAAYGNTLPCHLPSRESRETQGTIVPQAEKYFAGSFEERRSRKLRETTVIWRQRTDGECPNEINSRLINWRFG